MSDTEDPQQQQHIEEENADVHFEPVIKLEHKVAIKTWEEEEDVVFKMRARLFRFDPASSEWKERGTGDVRLLQHNENKKVRLVMRRDKTHKVCANHIVAPTISLQPNLTSDRSWVWTAHADFSDGEAKAGTLAIRLANAENANKFKKAFEFCQSINRYIEKESDLTNIPVFVKDPALLEESTHDKSGSAAEQKKAEKAEKAEEAKTEATDKPATEEAKTETAPPAAAAATPAPEVKESSPEVKKATEEVAPKEAGES